jgi:hypothetical protein
MQGLNAVEIVSDYRGDTSRLRINSMSRFGVLIPPLDFF